MESETLQRFISKAEYHLPMIRNAFLICSQEGNLGGELETSLYYSQEIKEAAVSVGLNDVGAACEKLESELKNSIGLKKQLSDAQIRNLLDNLAQIEALLAKVKFSAEDTSLNFDGFVDQSFINLGLDSLETKSSTENEAEAFDIDEEMLEIFAEEADDLLRNINSHLEILQSAPNNRESLLEIRRNAHTLKGSAGIVGLKLLSKLAHRVEDLLDHLAEKKVDGNEKIFELLQSSTDCLSALASGENSPQMPKRIELLYRNFDEILYAIEKGTFEKDAAKAARAGKSNSEAAAEHPASENPSAVPAPKSVIRVSLEKLDELVRLIGDLVISRSVFERRLAEFEHQIGELQHSTNRLMRSTGKLETDFEANMLQGTGSRFQVPNSNSSLVSTQPSSLNFDALEFDHYTEFHQTTRELLETAGDTSAINLELDRLRSNLEMLFSSQSRLIEEMHDKLLHLRMIRFGSLAARLQRTVRVTCEEEMKQADLIIEGEQTEVDSQILDLLAEPLLHLLRNAVAHGIESPDTRRLLGKPERGKILLRLHSEGTHVILTITDDGRGISAVALREKAIRNGLISPEEAEKMTDEEAFSLGFLPGLTTAEGVSQTAGRGVGMNIVKTSVSRGQGTISIASKPQKGTTFTIRMPMALAITRGLLVKINGQTFAFPLKLVKKISEISAFEFADLAEKPSLSIDGTDYKIKNLGTLLNFPASNIKKELIPLLLLETSETPCALTVDEIVRAEEIVIKPLTSPLENYPNLIGATILGDGNVVPVLDLIYLLKNGEGDKPRKAEKIPVSPDADFLSPSSPSFLTPPRQISVMVVDDSPSVRHITSKSIKNAGWQVFPAKDGLEAFEALQAGDALPDIVLTDVEMPRMDGYELLASIRSHEDLKHLPVIMITSRASEKHRQRAAELGVSEYMTKPFDDSVLTEKIKLLVDSYRTK